MVWTQGDLVRYDGYNMKVYSRKLHMILSSLNGGNIKTIYEDKFGKIVDRNKSMDLIVLIELLRTFKRYTNIPMIQQAIYSNIITAYF